MTRQFTPPDWTGQTVAVLASGKSLTQELADSVKGLRRIAVRRAFRLAPDADIVLALDAPPNFGFWDESHDFAGARVCGVEVDDLDAYHLHIRHERVEIEPGHVIEIRNNGLAAIRLAAMTGASKIVLLGFDAPPYSHFYGAADPDWDRYPGLAQGLAAIAAELSSRGIDVDGAPAPAAGPAIDYLAAGELDHIISLLASAQPKAVVEFGCNAGRTAAAILTALPGIERYVGIDAEPGHATTLAVQQNEIPRNPGAVVNGDARFELVLRPRGSFDVTARDLGSVDAAFIDGDHSRAGVLNDYALAKGAVRPGGIIVFHDDGREDMEVASTLRELEAAGANIERIAGTTLAFERLPKVRKGRS